MAFDPSVDDAEAALADEPLTRIPLLDPIEPESSKPNSAPFFAPPEAFQGKPRQARADRPDLRGRLITIQPGSTVQEPTSAIASPIEREERTWTVSLQPVTLPFYPIAIPGIITAIVTYSIGQASFSKIVSLPTLNLVKFTVQARRVEISLYVAGNYLSVSNGINVLPTVQCAVSPGNFTGPDGYAWQWGQPQFGATGLLYTGPGVVGQLHVSFQTAAVPGTPLWPLFFDVLTVGAIGAAQPPIRGSRLGAIANVGDDRSYSDEVAPGSVQFTNGLFFVLSTTAAVYTAPAAGNQAAVEAKVGT